MAVLERNLNTVFIISVIYIDYGALLANLESDVLNPFALIGDPYTWVFTVVPY